ncbi:MAG: endonuclease VII domain-containing protein [Candidatus Gracilibacteria bacterium]|jgi:hypothetical protein
MQTRKQIRRRFYLKHREKNREKQKAKSLDYYYKNKAKCKKRNKEWIKKNYELWKSYGKKYRNKNFNLISKREKEYYKNNSEKILFKSFECRLKKFNITIEQYTDMLKRQKGLCAICGCKGNNKNLKLFDLVLDHCHKSGRVRGLLCTTCNLMLGHAKDDKNKLQKAIDYLSCYD